MSGGLVVWCLVVWWHGVWLSTLQCEKPQNPFVLSTFVLRTFSELRRQARLQSPKLGVQVFTQTGQIGRENSASGIAGTYFPPPRDRESRGGERFEQERLAGHLIDLDDADQNGTKKHRESLSTASKKSPRDQSEVVRGCYTKSFVEFEAAG